MVAYIIIAIAGLVIGFVIGALVYRNNVKRLQASEASLKAKVNSLKNEAYKAKAEAEAKINSLKAEADKIKTEAETKVNKAKKGLK